MGLLILHFLTKEIESPLDTFVPFILSQLDRVNFRSSALYKIDIFFYDNINANKSCFEINIEQRLLVRSRFEAFIPYKLAQIQLNFH